VEAPLVAQQQHGHVEAPANGLLPDDAFREFGLLPPPPPHPLPQLDVAPATTPPSEEPEREPPLVTFGRDFDSALHVAIRENATEAALGLMNAGAFVDAQNSKAVTPLILASQKGNLMLVEELWKRGASLLHASVTGCTPLIQAAHFGHLSIVEFLLDKGASMEVGNHNATTPLMRAAQEGHFDIVALLLKKGAEVNRRNNEQMSALMLASQRGHASIVELLVDAGAQVDAMTTQDSTSLMLACKRGHVNVVRVLVTAGCELWIRDSRGRTAKDMAVRKNASELVTLLDPDVQVDLMRRKSRTQRNYTMVQMWTLLQQERARVPLMLSNASIHNVTADLLITTGSFSALVRTMALPAPLLEHIASYMPLPRLWERRTALILKQCTVDPNAAIAASLELIDEALVEGGFVEACDEANVTPPTSFSSWVRIRSGVCVNSHSWHCFLINLHFVPCAA
jgi:ankyrin repeat protein